MADEASNAASGANSKAKKGRGNLTGTDMGEVTSRAKKAGHGKGTNVQSSMSTAKPKGSLKKSKKK